jgi:DtxR family Mn-dependent transcriptional regulator
MVQLANVPPAHYKNHGVGTNGRTDRPGSSAFIAAGHSSAKQLFGDEVHAEADRLEHVISEVLEERIARALGDPHYDPHGDPIPNREFRLPEQSTTSLADLHPGDQASIVRITTDEPGLLRYLASIGLSLHNQVTVIDVSPYDGNTTLAVRGGEHILGPRITSRIYVRLNSSPTNPV